jgi:CheY-like chemotaxis protein
MSRAILLVDDDENDVMFTTIALQRAGVSCPVQVVKNGREALAYLSGEGKFADREQYPVPYLVFLDLKLPFIMGLDILKWLRARPQFDGTVVLVLTSSQQPEDVRTAYQLRANAFLVKPSGLDKLVPLVQSVKDFWLLQNQPESAFSFSTLSATGANSAVRPVVGP